MSRLSSMDGTGITYLHGKVLRALQADGAAAIGIFSSAGFERIALSQEALDIHDILCVEDKIFVACTQLNAVLELDLNFQEVRRWTFPGEADSVHLNCLCFYRGRLLASFFGTSSAHRGYKGNTAGQGVVRDVVTEMTIISGMSQPHSLRVDGDQLILCNSESGELFFYNGDVCVRRIEVGGYVRGIALGPDHYFVGVSLSRNIDTSALGASTSAEIVAIERESGREAARFAVPAREIYDLCILDDEMELGTVAVAAVEEVTEAHDALKHKLSGELEKRTRWATSLDKELASRSASLVSLQKEHEQVAAWAKSRDGELFARSASLVSLQKEHEETVVWAKSLDSELAARNASLVLLQKEHEETVAWAKSLDSELAERNASLVLLQKEHEKTVAWAKSLDSELAACSASLVLLQKEHEETVAWAKSLDRELAARNASLVLLQKEHEETASWAKSLESELAACKASLVLLQKEHE